MAKNDDFMTISRLSGNKRPVDERLKDYNEVEVPFSDQDLIDQSSRCMDCGIPFCHNYGCPLGNKIPAWNDFASRDKLFKAIETLHATNNFPEFTGRICPAPCESACTLAVNHDAVAIRCIEQKIAEKAWEKGRIVAKPPREKTGKKIAIVGSGPTGLAAAQQLARMGHDVIVYEKSEFPGGLLRYGIPDFKLEKWTIDRRLEQLKEEGVVFETGVEVGVDISAKYLKRTFDAVLLAAGSEVPRDIKVPGREISGTYFAMEFLAQQNKRNAEVLLKSETPISAKGKNILVIGGGDTGSDCIGTSRRQGANTITQIELLPEPPKVQNTENPWPEWPLIKRTSSSHDEGCERMWSINTKEILSKNGKVTGIKAVKLEWTKPKVGERPSFKETEGSEFIIKADLILLATGFIHVEHNTIVEDLELSKDNRGNIEVKENYSTSVDGVFAAGDCKTGASIVVRCINEGRLVAEEIADFLK